MSEVTEEMSELNQLFVSACKAEDAEKEVDKLYIENHMAEISDQAIANILIRIAEEANIIRVMDLINEMSPERNWYYNEHGGETDYWKRVKLVLIQIIRYTKTDDLKGLATS